MRKRILALLLALVFVILALVSCANATDSVEGKTYEISKISFKFNKDASTHEKYLFLEAVRILADDESLTEKKALDWTEKFVLDMCKNYTAEFKNGRVTESFGEMSSSMVKESDEEKIELKKAALHTLGEAIFNMTLESKNADGESTPNYELIIDEDGVKAQRLGEAESVFEVSGYSRYLDFKPVQDHMQNNRDTFIAQANAKNETLNYRYGKIKQALEKDGFVIKITYKNK